MLPLIYTTPAYTIIFVGVIVITRLPEVIRANRWRPERDPTARQVDRGSLVVMSVVVGGGVIVACVLPLVWTSATITLLRPQLTLVGIGVIVLGAVLRWWSIFAVLPNLPKYGHARPGVEFLLLRRQLHTRLAPRASAGDSTGV